MGQLVLVGNAEDLCYRGAYRLGRMHCLPPQTCKGKQMVRRATIAVLRKASVAGSTQIDYVLRDLSEIPPIQLLCELALVIMHLLSNFIVLCK